MYLYTINCRGQTFRNLRSCIGEIRSLLPVGVPVLALTATITRVGQIKVSKLLGLQNNLIISKSPSKDNITYRKAPFISVKENFSGKAKQLDVQRSCFPRTIILLLSVM